MEQEEAVPSESGQERHPAQLGKCAGLDLQSSNYHLFNLE